MRPNDLRSIARALGAAAALACAASACDPPPPIKTASGERIDGVSYEERFPLSSDAHDVTFHGDRLRKAVALMDKNGVMGMSGTYEATGVVDKSTLVVTITTVDNRERKIVLRNCAETHVCAFFAEAARAGVVPGPPVVCRDALACTKK